MKPKSLKLRMLVTLHAIMKYSDENHRMNSVKLNQHLKPYNLECTNRVISTAIEAMREFGFNVQSKGEWDNQGIWIKDRPLSDDNLDAFIFAVTTNPYLSKEESERILGNLTPFVTVYQEPLLKSYIEKTADIETSSDLYQKYRVVCEAISLKRRVRYRIPYLKYDYNTQSVRLENQWPTLFTPKCLYQLNNKLYMVGYNNTDQRTDAVELDSIAEIKLAFKHKDPKAEQIEDILKQIDPLESIKTKKSPLLYKGKAVFKCRGQYVQDLYRKFGPPSAPVLKDPRCRCVYTIDNAEITSDTLHQLLHVSDNNIRIIGPEELTIAIREYYSQVSDKLLNPVISSKRKG